MILKKNIILLLLAFSFTLSKAQIPFDSTLIYTQNQKLNKLYNSLMEEVSSIKIFKKNSLPIVTPWPSRKGEATFIYEVSDTGSLLNVYITEFWWYWYSSLNNEVTVKDYIVFVDDNSNIGFTQNKLLEYKLNPMSQEIINFLFKYVNENMSFKVIKPRQQNLKFHRLKF